MREDKPKEGCTISPRVGVVLAFLVVAMVTAVGLIVFFAANNKTIECRSSPDTGTETESLTQRCEKLIEQGKSGNELCSKCHAQTCSKSTPSTRLVTSSTESSSAPSSPTPSPTSESPTEILRLPASLKPTHYDVQVQPYMAEHYSNPKDFRFKGFVRVTMECEIATDNITLHFDTLKVDYPSIKVYSPDLQPFDLSSVKEDKVNQFLIIGLDKRMQVGKTYMIEMTYSSPMVDQRFGFQFSHYKENNKTMYLASTQFEPTGARKAFPCMDEPALKATFNITVVRPAHLKSFSNMPLADSSWAGTEEEVIYFADKFHKTPVMSTYLVAFAVGDLDYLENTTSNRVKVRVIVSSGAKNQTLHALDVATRLLPFFGDYFRFNYNLPKEDLIGVPRFNGGMENWGLVVFGSDYLIYKPGVSNIILKYITATIIGHELAHQWFGNLVTCAWWDGIWLNEGFAMYFGNYVAMDYLYPDQNVFDSFGVNHMQEAFSADSSVTSHPIHLKVNARDFETFVPIFGQITYFKGASLIRMMSKFLGRETLQKGLRKYLQKMQYKAAVQDDLWNALAEQAKSENRTIDVKDIMDTWTLQMNFPVVMVTRDQNFIQVHQSRYLSDYTQDEMGVYQSPFGYRWNIPLTFTSSQELEFTKGPDDVLWISKNESTKSFQMDASFLPPVANKQGWILANVQQTGYYRVNYDEHNWAALIQQLKEDHTVLPVAQRAQIMNDAWNLVSSGDLPLSTALKTLEYLGKEMSYVPWSAAISELKTLQTLLAGSPADTSFRNFLANITETIYSQCALGNCEAEGQRQLDTMVSVLACASGSPSCARHMLMAFSQWLKDTSTNRIRSRYPSLAYCYGVRSHGEKLWDPMYQKYLNTSNLDDKLVLLKGLTCTKQPSHWLRLFHKSLESGLLPDVVYAFSEYDTDGTFAWEFLKVNYDVIRNRFKSVLPSIFQTSTNGLNTEEARKEIEEFLKAQESTLDPSSKDVLQSAVRSIDRRVRWLAVSGRLSTVQTWLAGMGYTDAC